MQHRLLSIDPGTVNLGVAISDIGENMKVVHAANFSVKKAIDPMLERSMGRKLHVRTVIKHYLYGMIAYWQPSAVISEVPYLNESLNSFLSLYECNMATKQAIREYSETMQFIGIDPASAKKSLGIPGNSGDKDLVYQSVIDAEHIDLSDIYINQLSEHAIDAILIGNSYFKNYTKWRLKWT